MLAGHKDNHKSLDGFEFRRNSTTFKQPRTLIVSYIWFCLLLKLFMIISDYICIKLKSISVMINSENYDFD